MISDDCAVVQGILGHACSLLDPSRPPQLTGNSVEPMGVGEMLGIRARKTGPTAYRQPPEPGTLAGIPAHSWAGTSQGA